MLRKEADKFENFLKRLDRCYKVEDLFRDNLDNMLASISSKFEIPDAECDVYTVGDLSSCNTIVRMLGKEYTVTDNNGNMIMSPDDVVKKVINSLRYQERKASRLTSPSDDANYSHDLLDM